MRYFSTFCLKGTNADKLTGKSSYHLIYEGISVKKCSDSSLCRLVQLGSWVWNLLPFPLQFQSPSIKNALKRNFFSYRRITPSSASIVASMPSCLLPAWKGFISVHMKGEKQRSLLCLLFWPLFCIQYDQLELVKRDLWLSYPTLTLSCCLENRKIEFLTFKVCLLKIGLNASCRCRHRWLLSVSP